jgi:hypothetical protein
MQDGNALMVTPGNDPAVSNFKMSKPYKRHAVEVTGTDTVDMLVVLDYSGSFYRPDLEVIVGEEGKPSSGDSEQDAAFKLVAGESTPEVVDFSRKDATVFLFKGMHSGHYTFKLRESFKKKNDC